MKDEREDAASGRWALLVVLALDFGLIGQPPGRHHSIPFVLANNNCLTQQQPVKGGLLVRHSFADIPLLLA